MEKTMLAENLLSFYNLHAFRKRKIHARNGAGWWQRFSSGSVIEQIGFVRRRGMKAES